VTQELLEKARCPECGSSHIIRDEDMGEFVCSNCGLVIKDDILDQSPEWRATTLEEKQAKKRVGPPTDYTHYDKGLSTTITLDRDAFGRPLSPDVRRQMWRLRRWHIRSRIRENKTRNLMRAMNELERLSDKLNVPSAAKARAAMIYRKALDEDLVKGRSIAAVLAASLYAACRLAQLPKSLDEFSEASTRDKREISRCYRLLLRRLRIKMPVHDPLEYVSKIGGDVGIAGEIQGLAIRLLREAHAKGLISGKDPRGVAAAILYIASKLKDEHVTQKEIAEAAGITEVTIRNRKRGLLEGLKLKI
jgi:transcription initiation factor TFIIB